MKEMKDHWTLQGKEIEGSWNANTNKWIDVTKRIEGKETTKVCERREMRREWSNSIKTHILTKQLKEVCSQKENERYVSFVREEKIVGGSSEIKFEEKLIDM